MRSRSPCRPAPRRGNRYGVIWAAVSSPTQAGSNVTLVNRVGVRMYTSIGSGCHCPLELLRYRLARRALELWSTLGRSQGPQQRRNDAGHRWHLGTLYEGPGGLRSGPYVAKLAANLAPGASEAVTTKLQTDLPLGPWRADFGLESGFVQRSDVATITFAPRTSRADRTRWSPVVTIAIVGLLILLLIVFESPSVRLDDSVRSESRPPRPR